MSRCPSCYGKLPSFYGKKTCPSCGAGITHSDMKKKRKDPRLAELKRARSRVRRARIKCSLFGGSLQVIKLLCVFLPVAALFLESADAALTFELFTKSFSISAAGLFSVLDSGVAALLPRLSRGFLLGNFFSAVAVCYVALAVCMVCALLCAAAEMFCYIKYRRAALFSAVTGAVGVLGAAVCGISSYWLVFVSAGTHGVATASVGVGFYAAAAAFAVVAVLNGIAFRRGIRVRCRTGDLNRVRIAGMLKRGELTLEQLPYPVYDSERDMPKQRSAAAATSRAEHLSGGDSHE